MNCEQMNQMLSAWLDGEVTPQEEEQMMAHLDRCAVVGEVADTHHTNLDVLVVLVEVEDDGAEGGSGLAARLAHRTCHVERKNHWNGVRMLIAVATLTNLEAARVERRVNASRLEGLSVYSASVAVVTTSKTAGICSHRAV